MDNKEILYQGSIFIIFSIIVIILLTDLSPSLTGSAVYIEVETEKVWDFVNVSEYTYDPSVMIDGTARLGPTTVVNTTIIEETNESILISAFEHEEDDDDEGKNVTKKVQSLGEGHVQIKKSESVLEVRLADSLQDNDLLSLYLLSGTGDGGKAYLCKNKAGCSSSEYGSLALPETFSEWYNITISGLPETNDTFFLASSDKLKIDMVKGYKKSTWNETIISISYPSSASLQTFDLQPTDWQSWGFFSKQEQLHGQQVQYEYSVNSGLSWNAVPLDGNLSSVLENKIRFRVTFSSNTTTTPEVNSIKITYTSKSSCTENWLPYPGSCLVNDSQLKSYIDVNDCGTTVTLPSDNGTSVSCDYCVPRWDEINSSCRKDDLIKAAFTDANNCYALTSLASDNDAPPAKNYSCDYCALFNCSQSAIEESVAEVRGNKTIYVVDAQAEAHTRLEIEAGNSTSVEIIHYAHNIKNETPSAKALDRYVDLHASEIISAATIILYYNDTETAVSDIDENSLQIYYYNETSSQWQALSSTVNVSGNYVSTTVPHLSLYGLFGQQQTESSSNSISQTGGGNGGTILQENTILEKISPKISETISPILSEFDHFLEPAPTSERSCNYVVEMSLPDEIILKENESYQGEIVNKGNCEIATLSLELSPELQPQLELLSVSSFSLEPGNKTNFILIRKKTSSDDLFSVTSYAISSLKADPAFSGYLVLEGHDEEKNPFRKELPVKIIMKSSIPWRKLITAILIMVVLVLAVLRSFYDQNREK